MRITRTRQTCRIAVLVLPALLALARPTRADDALPVETLKKIKAATVFLKIENGNEEASGTGFVVYTAGTTAYIATNHHVVNPQEGQPNFGLPRTPAITVVFGSGTPAERSARATVVAAIPRTDLAIRK
jgi:S1-C subfamily serine protease